MAQRRAGRWVFMNGAHLLLGERFATRTRNKYAHTQRHEPNRSDHTHRTECVGECVCERIPSKLVADMLCVYVPKWRTVKSVWFVGVGVCVRVDGRQGGELRMERRASAT